jgi:SPP1 gp7 family putative phage head morphogenesis protein
MNNQALRRKPLSSPRLLRGGILSPSVSAEVRYGIKIRHLVARMIFETKQSLRQFYKTETAETYFAEDASVAAQAKILTDALIRKFEGLFSLEAKPLAEEMLHEANSHSIKTIENSTNQFADGLTLKADIFTPEMKEIIGASVTENVSLIKSIASKYLGQVQQAVMRSITEGGSYGDLVKFLHHQEGVTMRRARFIANEQTKTAFVNINAARLQKMGVDEFEWVHSKGALHPRKLHESYNGRIFKISEPPVIDERTGRRGLPAQIWNCNCLMKPVLNFGE